MEITANEWQMGKRSHLQREDRFADVENADAVGLLRRAAQQAAVPQRLCARRVLVQVVVHVGG